MVFLLMLRKVYGLAYSKMAMLIIVKTIFI